MKNIARSLIQANPTQFVYRVRVTHCKDKLILNIHARNTRKLINFKNQINNFYFCAFQFAQATFSSKHLLSNAAFFFFKSHNHQIEEKIANRKLKKMENFAGKAVSIRLKRDLGVFQGTITCAEAHAITIANVFHNGNKIDYKNSEVSAKFLF